MPGPSILVFGRDQADEAAVQETAARAPEQGNRRQVDLVNQPIGGQGEITHRGKFIEVTVAVARLFQCRLRLAQSVVLHLKFDLMNLQFEQQLFG